MATGVLIQKIVQVNMKYRQTSNISRNTIVDHSDIVGAAAAGAAPTTSVFSA